MRLSKTSLLGSWLGALLCALPASVSCAQETSEPVVPIERGAARPGIWLSRAEIARLPTSGAAWENLLAVAAPRTLPPRLWHPDDLSDVMVLAQALVFARTGEERYRSDVIEACMDVLGTEGDGEETWQGDCLALARNLPAYVIAAELVGLPPEEDARFRDWLAILPRRPLRGHSLRSVHELRPNNWGTNAGAARAVIARYLGDEVELERVARVFRGWLGEREYYAGFRWTYSRSWQADPERPVGINPSGAVREGHSIDGVLADEQRRAGDFTWPPPRENYVWEGLQGAMVQAVVLERAGYDAFAWADRALLRAFRWLHEVAGFEAGDDDEWLPHLANAIYGTRFPAPTPARPGKNLAWTDWTHASGN